MKKFRPLERKVTLTCKHCDFTRETAISGPERELNYHCSKCFDFLWENKRIVGRTCLCGDRFYLNIDNHSEIGDDE